MVVAGSECTIFDDTNKTCTVNSFSESAGKLENVKIVDVVVAYDCPYKSETFLLLMRNALNVPELPLNLIPPFIMREGGIEVDECPKSQLTTPQIENHSMYCEAPKLRIHFELNGTFSSFKTRKPTNHELEVCDKIFITPDSGQWDPYSDHFAANEAAMLNHEGVLIQKNDRHPSIEAPLVDSYLNLPSIKVVDATIDEIISTGIDNCELAYQPQSLQDNKSLPNYEAQNFANELLTNTLLGKISATFGEIDGDEKPGVELFTTLEDFNEDFQSEISALEAIKKTGTTPEFIKKIWSISDKEAKAVVEANTQLNRQPNDGLLSRHFSTNDRMLRYRRINSYFFTDTLLVTKASKSTRNNLYLQVFVSDKGFVAVYCMERKSDFKDALHLFCKEIGVPISLVVDPSGEQTSKAVRKFCNQVGTTLRVLEESTQWANRAELYIGFLKKAIRKDLQRSDCPLVLWDYCAQRRALIHNLTPRDLFQTEKQSPFQYQFGVQGDISNLCSFDWYDWCYYREEGTNIFPRQKELLGRVLGPSKNEGNEMAQWVLTATGHVVPRRSVRKLSLVEINKDSEKSKRLIFDKLITQKLGDSTNLPPSPIKPSFSELDEYNYDPRESDSDEPIGWIDGDPIEPDGTAVFENSRSDTLINAEVLLPQGEDIITAKVKGRHVTENGEVVGKYNTNPTLNSIIYDVSFPNGAVKQYAANTIAEALYSTTDNEGHSKAVLDCILEHSKNDRAISKTDRHIITKSGNRRIRKTTIGWNILVRWKNQTEAWVPLKLMKENYPVQIAEYARACHIDDEPAFQWWVPYTLRKRDAILSAVKARTRHVYIKYGINVPRTTKEATELDLAAGNTMWQDAIDLEMNTIMPAFDLVSDGERAPPGYSKASGHIIFDVKMDFTRKARFVKNGHLNPDPIDSNFAGVVSRDSIRIIFTYAAVNGLDIYAADIKSAYLQAPTSEKHFILCGDEFPLEMQGRIALIKRALYGGKSAGSDYWKHMRTCMEHLGFTSCKADPDVWMREAVKPDGHEYWEYVLLYVDDALCCSCNPKEVLSNELGKFWTMKKGSIGPPNKYLGNKVSKVTLENGVKCWSFSSAQYVIEAVNNVERHLKSKGQSLPKKAPAPFEANYRPEIDISAELSSDEANYFQSLIGIVRWIVELGRIDIAVEVSMLSSMMAMPRKGHLLQLYHIFAYLKQRYNSEMVFNPTLPDFDESCFIQQDWTYTPYSKAREAIPTNAPITRGLGVKVNANVDSDHAGDNITRRSRTGYVIFLNSSPIYFHTKKQGRIETSTFGSEFIAMKQCCEYIRGLRYKLRMMGIGVDGPAYIYGDNKSVLVNSSIPTSVLKKSLTQLLFILFVKDVQLMNGVLLTLIHTTMLPTY